MKVLLTGYSGFLGQYLAREVIKEGYSLRVLFHRHTLTRKDMPQDVEVIWGSMDNPDVIKQAVRGVDFVVHSAWASDSSFEKRPTFNERAADLLLSESVDAGVKKFVFISSVAVYGMRRKTRSDIQESSPFAEVKDLAFKYPSEKIVVEKNLQSWEKNKTQLAVFRPGPVFDDHKGPHKKIIKLGPWRMGLGIGTGRNRMAYIHGRDVAKAAAGWLKHGNDGAVFNVVPSQCLRSRDWIRVWGLKNNLSLKPFFIPGFMMRLAGFGVKTLKRMLGRKSGSNVKYAVACAKRDMCYSNKAIKKALDWEDKATSEYLEIHSKK